MTAYVLDTNMLMSVLGLNQKSTPKTVEQIDQCLSKIQTQVKPNGAVFVPRLVLDEVSRHNVQAMIALLKEYEDKAAVLADCFSDALDPIAFKPEGFSAASSVSAWQKQYNAAYWEMLERRLGSNIIPTLDDADTFIEITQRSLEKVPPFLRETASDRGFKDTVIWLSTIRFFEMNRVENVLFVTGDKGFTQQGLEDEFRNCTGHDIKFRGINTIKSKLRGDENRTPSHVNVATSSPLERTELDPEDVNTWRDLIARSLNDVFETYVEHQWYMGMAPTVELEETVDAEFALEFLESLSQTCSKFEFRREVSAADIFPSSGPVRTTGTLIPMSALDNLRALYVRAQAEIPDRIPAFADAVMAELNKHVRHDSNETDDELPF